MTIHTRRTRLTLPTYCHTPPASLPPPPPRAVDFGFEHHDEFDRGKVDVLRGTEGIAEIHTLQRSLTFGQRLSSGVLIVLSCAFPPYLLSKLTLVRKGEIGLVRHVDGTMRVIGPGWHLMETIGTSIVKAPLSSDNISHGMVFILRVLPGQVGMGTLNGRAVFLLSGRHLINDPLFVFKGTASLTKDHIEVVSDALLVFSSRGDCSAATAEKEAAGAWRETRNYLCE